MTADELSERYALVKKLKSELKNEEMALVLLKKLKQSQTIQREATTVGGGATLTPANKTGSKEKAMFSNKNSDHAMAKELVSNTFTLHIYKSLTLVFQNNMLSKSSTGGLMNNSLNASLLAAAGIDARLLSQMNASYSQQQPKQRESPKPKPEPETKESQAQRQAAAKLALRKQLEKTLLQVEDPSHNHPCHNCSNLADPTTKTAAAGNAFHPEPGEHGVHLLDRPGGVRQPDPEPGRGAAGHAHPLLLQPVRHRLHPHLEVGQGCQG